MTSYQSIDQSANRKNLRALLLLRGIAFCAQVAAIFITYYGFNIVLPVAAMMMTASVLAAFNIYSLYRLRSGVRIGNAELFTGLVVDVVVLALQLYFSGGTYNPFVSFFMLPVIIGAVMLEAAYAWFIYALTLLCYLALAIAGLAEQGGRMAHMPGMDMASHADAPLVDRSMLHMNGMMLGYAACAGLLVFMTMRIRANLRARDAELEALKASALEEDHFVRMGLLSAGAAHELGTPLTTLSVILRDLINLPMPRKKADLMADLMTMDAQISRCKSIVSDILAASGEVRGEGARVLSLDAFFDDIVSEWRALHPQASLQVIANLPSVPVAADAVIKQVLFNLLDNAAEALETSDMTGGRDSITLSAAVDGEELRISVRDQGAGFSGAVLSRLGQPYVSTKDPSPTGHGRGLGLFLVSNALRKLGGTFAARNASDQMTGAAGAIVDIALPLSAIAVERRDVEP